MNDVSWPTSTLEALLDDTIGGLWGNAADSANAEDTDVLVVRGADFRSWDSRRALDAAPRRIPARALDRRVLAAGDLVLEVSGGSPAQPVGRVVLIDKRTVSEAVRPLICSNFCRKLRLRPGVDPHFVKRQLDWLYRSGFTEQFQTSTTNIRNLQVEDFLKAAVLTLPDLAIQHAISACLDELDLKRSNSLTHVAAGQRAGSRLRQSVLAAACSGRLTADWREVNARRGTETAAMLIERSVQAVEQAGRRVRVAPWSEPDWLDLPESWRWAPMRDLAAIKGGIQKQPKRTPRTNGYPYLRVANVLRGRLDLAEVHEFELFDGELETYRLEPGDLLIVEGNGSASEIGRSALWSGEIADCVHQNHIIRVRCPLMDARFVDFFWNSPIGAREVSSLAVTSAGLYSLSTKKIGAALLPVPPLEEQHEIVRRVALLLNLTDGLIGRAHAAARNIDRSSQAILAKAFHGELAEVVR